MRTLTAFVLMVLAMPAWGDVYVAHLGATCEVTTPDGITSKFHSQNLYLSKNKSVTVHQIRFELNEVFRAYFRAEWMGQDVAASVHIKNNDETKFSKTNARLIEGQKVDISALVEPETWVMCALKYLD